jgi:hypothetical protein
LEIPFAIHENFDLGQMGVAGGIADGLAAGFDADVERKFRFKWEIPAKIPRVGYKIASGRM